LANEQTLPNIKGGNFDLSKIRSAIGPLIWLLVCKEIPRKKHCPSWKSQKDRCVEFTEKQTLSTYAKLRQPSVYQQCLSPNLKH